MIMIMRIINLFRYKKTDEKVCRRNKKLQKYLFRKARV